MKNTRGEGRYVLHSTSDLAPSINLLKEGTCVLEAWIPYEKELSVLIYNKGRGEFATFPVVEKLGGKHMTCETISLSRIDDEVSGELQRIAKVIAKAVGLVGTLSIEMFYTETGGIYVNKILNQEQEVRKAKIDDCSFSQYDTQILCLCNWPMPKS
ncbi:ATP-grasp domain-containing protein [Enterococcus faecalis]|uniref:ATP-grasp domain-containing protein n=1 Tax=Enterococcus faecalis TaxID=1351 RepID=UPI003DA10CA6